MNRIIILIIGFLITFSSYAQHVIVKKNNDQIKGIVMEIKYDTLTYVSSNNQIKKMHMREVSTIFFSEYVAYDGGLLATDEEKYAKAQFAAMETKFNAKDNAPIKTTGTLTITY